MSPNKKTQTAPVIIANKIILSPKPILYDDNVDPHLFSNEYITSNKNAWDDRSFKRFNKNLKKFNNNNARNNNNMTFFKKLKKLLYLIVDFLNFKIKNRIKIIKLIIIVE